MRRLFASPSMIVTGMLGIVLPYQEALAEPFRECQTDYGHLFEFVDWGPDQLRLFHVGEYPSEEELLARFYNEAPNENGTYLIKTASGDCLYEFEALQLFAAMNVVMKPARWAGFPGPSFRYPETCLARRASDPCPMWDALGIYDLLNERFPNCAMDVEHKDPTCVDDVDNWLTNDVFYLYTFFLNETGRSQSLDVVLWPDGWRVIND